MRRGRKRILTGLVGLLVIVAVYSGFCVLRPLKLAAPVSHSTLSLPLASTSSVTWPSTGQSAVSLVGSTNIETHGAQAPTPTASVAKLITALVVLKAKPLSGNDQGPLITLTANDVALYDHYVAEQGSVVPVEAGEAISEYQLLEGMLLPSANNMADTLAIWAYGSLPAYAQAANAFLAQAGLTETHVGIDASGYDPSTTSTAHDLVMLGELTLKNPVLAGIVNQSSVTGIPLTTTVTNVNSLLGTDNIIGIKTGNTNQAGGVFVSASQVVVNNKQVTIVTALAGSPTLAQALKSSLPFIQSTHTNFQTATLIKAGTVVGGYALPWGGTVSAVASKELSVTAWRDSGVAEMVKLNPISVKTTPNSSVGSVTAEQLPLVSNQAVPVQLAQSIPQPSLWWRLTHPSTTLTF